LGGGGGAVSFFPHAEKTKGRRINAMIDPVERIKELIFI
jgi:hypothetical protein